MDPTPLFIIFDKVRLFIEKCKRLCDENTIDVDFETYLYFCDKNLTQ